MARFWLVVFPLARGQLRAWERVAEAIPDPELRAQALDTLDSERLSAAGAALFAATAPRRRDPDLVRALVAFQVICDYLDTLAEQPTDAPVENGAQLHRALADAVSSDPHRDYYRLHRVRGDGGYLLALVDACRSSCAALPSFALVQELAWSEARRNEVQGINHAPAEVREPALRDWAEHQREPATGDASWFELAAAGSSSLAVLALMAAAADPAATRASVERVRHAYFPWIEALSTLLDSLADREQDVREGALSFIGHYPSPEATIVRLQQVTARAIAGARRLPNGERHVVLIAGMIAMHLSEATAWLPAAQPSTRAVLATADSAVTPLLLLLLRTWRRARAERARRDEPSYSV